MKRLVAVFLVICWVCFEIYNLDEEDLQSKIFGEFVARHINNFTTKINGVIGVPEQSTGGTFPVDAHVHFLFRNEQCFMDIYAEINATTCELVRRPNEAPTAGLKTLMSCPGLRLAKDINVTEWVDNSFNFTEGEIRDFVNDKVSGRLDFESFASLHKVRPGGTKKLLFYATLPSVQFVNGFVSVKSIEIVIGNSESDGRPTSSKWYLLNILSIILTLAFFSRKGYLRYRNRIFQRIAP
ncbi:unnamed protein product [Caenorhabditis auriculariae]|uniref:Uncharacterized protein n=1 Tax=Caenorhabditis auriculariae TaxID=2777116 RepID=A0A8S1HJZ7_9PELO|nr:unnamed protein product [Caenorhabditis auriculariae]